MHGRELLAQHAQPDPDPRRPGAQLARLVEVHRRGDRPVRRSRRGDVRVAPLATVGDRRRVGLPPAKQRDMYRYIHDQTMRQANHGLTPLEIAEMIELPEECRTESHTTGYYGHLAHNVKAVYQRYLSWYDGNPANLWKLPPTEVGRAVRRPRRRRRCARSPRRARRSTRATTGGSPRSSATSCSPIRRTRRPAICRPMRSNRSATRASRRRSATRS